MSVAASVLDLIGRTPMVELSRVARDVPARVLGKLELFNPSGSLKDRIGLYMLEEAERQGQLRPGGIVVEPTSGNTGISLAMACALKGYRLIAVMPETMSRERVLILKAYGAEVELTPCEHGQAGICTREDIERAIARAHELVKERGAFMPDQFHNPKNPEAHYHTTGVEIWEQTGGRIDAFVMGAGTAGTLMGCAQRLKEYDPRLRVILVEPANSAVISGRAPGSHKIQGTGEGFVPPLLRPDLYDEILPIDDEHAIATAQRLAREEGLIAGFSAGANLCGALQVAASMGPDQTVVTIICDTGFRYLSTELFGIQD
jgi:cysteine synthase A